MQTNLAFRLERSARETPDRAALIIRRGAIWEPFTFQYIHQLSDEIAGGFSAFGLRAGMRAGFMVPPGIEFFALALALLKAQIIPVLVDPALGQRVIARCLSDAAPEAYFGSAITNALRIFSGWGGDLIHIPITTGDVGGIQLREIRQLSNHTPVGPKLSGESEAAVIYTSGSTGPPKGAVFSHTNLATQIELLRREFKLGPDEIDLPAFPLFALIDCLLGITAVIPDITFPAPARSDPQKIMDAVQEFQVTTIFASPVELDRLAQFAVPKGLRLQSLRRVITAGAPAPVRVLEEFSKVLSETAELFGIYGATESLPISIASGRNLISQTRLRTEKGYGVYVGKPVKGTKVRVIALRDASISKWTESLELAPNTVGEITISGPAVSAGYVGPEIVNRRSKIKKGSEVMHRTGDLGFLDDRGHLWYCGRISQKVKTRYGLFFTEQIEGIFNAHPLVYRTALVGVDREPVLWVQLIRPAPARARLAISRELEDLARKHSKASKINREELARLAAKRLA